GVRQERALARYGDVTDPVECLDRCVPGCVPAGCFQPIGHALRAFDQELWPHLGLVRRGPETGEAGGLEAIALNGLERDGQQQPTDLVEFTQIEIRHGAVLSSKGPEWQWHAMHYLG